MTKAKRVERPKEEKNKRSAEMIFFDTTKISKYFKDCNSRDNTVKIRIKPKAGGYTVFFVYSCKDETGKEKIVYEYLPKEYNITANNKIIHQEEEIFRLIKVKRADKEKELRDHTTDLNTNFTAFFERYSEEKSTAKTKNGDENKCCNWRLVYKQFVAFTAGKAITFEDVKHDLCSSFAQYLINNLGMGKGNSNAVKTGKSNGNGTAYARFSLFIACINAAIKRDHIKTRNYATGIMVKPIAKKKDYLEATEIQLLLNAPIKHSEIKNIFFMGVFTGLRYSDLIRLQWSDILTRGEGENKTYSIVITQKKTGKPIELKLSKNAIKLIEAQEAVSKNTNIFNPPTLVVINGTLKKWAIKSGISETKTITMHTGRTSYILLCRLSGAPIEVIQRSVSHSDYATTLGYTNILDEEVNKLADMQKEFT